MLHGSHTNLVAQTSYYTHRTSHITPLQLIKKAWGFSSHSETGLSNPFAQKAEPEFWLISNWCRPISNLFSMIEHAVASHFISHISTHNLLPAQQSAYCSFHSMEKTIMSVHNYLVRATHSGQVSRLVLLDLSAAWLLLLSLLSLNVPRAQVSEAVRVAIKKCAPWLLNFNGLATRSVNDHVWTRQRQTLNQRFIK